VGVRCATRFLRRVGRAFVSAPDVSRCEWVRSSLPIAGSVGRAPAERLFAACDGTIEQAKSVPFDALLPADLSLPDGESVQVVAYHNHSFGCLQLTIGSGRIEGEFVTATPQALARADSFCLDMTTHRILAT
jgi:hypothetical protein